MYVIDMQNWRLNKENRFQLESEIITLVFEDNRNTVHFDYHVNIDDDQNSIRLDLYTRNSRNKEIFLLHNTSGTSSHDVLRKMLEYLKNHHKTSAEKKSYTVHWVSKKNSSGKKNTSYFFENSEEEVRKKFFYNKNKADFDIEIRENPIS